MSRFVPWLRAGRHAAEPGRRMGARMPLAVFTLSAATVGLLDTLLISGTGSYALGALDACATLACGVLALRIGSRSRRGKPGPTEPLTPTVPTAMADRASRAHKTSSRPLDSQHLHQRSTASRRRPRRA